MVVGSGEYILGGGWWWWWVLVGRGGFALGVGFILRSAGWRWVCFGWWWMMVGLF